METQGEGINGPAVIVFKEQVVQFPLGILVQVKFVKICVDLLRIIAVLLTEHGIAVGVEEFFIDRIHKGALLIDAILFLVPYISI